LGVLLTHETGVSLSTREHRDDHKNVTVRGPDDRDELLGPDVEIITEINTPASFETFGEVLQTGYGMFQESVHI